jgi:hypothetical protein
MRSETSSRAFFPDLNLFTPKRIAEIFPSRYNTKTRGGFPGFFKNPRTKMIVFSRDIGDDTALSAQRTRNDQRGRLRF